MGPQDISIISLIVCLALLILPLSLSILIKLKLIRTTLFAVVRMSVQLFLMAFFVIFTLSWRIILCASFQVGRPTCEPYWLTQPAAFIDPS